MPAPRIAEPLDVIERIGLGLFSRAVDLVATHSILSEEKKCSVAASVFASMSIGARTPHTFADWRY